MSDPRLTPANGRVAAAHLEGHVVAERFVQGFPMSLRVPVADLCEGPVGPRTRQLQAGALVTVYEDRDGWSFVQAGNGYVGYVASETLVAPVPVTHRVSSLATHTYEAPDIYSCGRDTPLYFGAKIRVIDERKDFFETDHGFIPKRHLRPLDRPFSDPATVAQLHFNVPYLWGGNSARGIDCSGLVSAAFEACEIPCPGDSDLQRDALGNALSSDAPLQRGDLVFWKGHVGMMVDADTLLHANAHHMAVAYEPFGAAVARIAAKEFGEIVARKRLD